MTARIAAFCMCLALCAARVLGADAPSLPVASDGNNLWVVTERMTPAGVERVLVHHAAAMGAAHAREVLTFAEVPEAMAAADGTLWLVFRPSDAQRSRREVYSLRTWHNAESGTSLYDPHGRMAILPSLRGGGELEGFACINGAPAAMLRGEVPHRLLPEGWAPIAGAPRGVMLLPWHRGGAVVTREEPIELCLLGGEPPAQRMTLELLAGSRVQPVTGASAPTVLVRNPDGTQVLARIEGGQPVPLAVIEPAKSAWAVAGLGAAFAVLSTDATGAVSMRRIDPATGQPGSTTVLTPPLASPGRWVPIALSGALIMLVGIGGVLLLNPRRAVRAPAPAGFMALPSARRGVALLIDLAPGFLAASLMGYPLESILRSPVASATAAGALPGLAMIGIAVAVCTVAELATGASIGKWVIGGRVARMTPAGDRPAVWQVLVRNVCKACVLMAPMMVIFNVFTPGFRGVGELLSGTAVIDREPAAAPLKSDPDKGR